MARHARAAEPRHRDGGAPAGAAQPDASLHDHLLTTKIAIPPRRPGAVRREALGERLVGSTAPLVSIAAPAGYGKTTLLTQWVGDDPRPFAWVTIDARDNDPVLLLRYLIRALGRAGIVTRSQTGRWLDASGEESLSVLHELCSALLGSATTFVIVLDDVHALTSVEALDMVELIGRSLPGSAQLVLGGRTEVIALTARRRAAGELLEIGVPDLAFDGAEAMELLGTAGTEIAPGVAAELVERTEGWAAGLYLATLALDSGDERALPDLAGVDRFVEDLLRVEHIARLPRRQAEFLRRTSVLERMSADLCNAALGRGDSARMLEGIESSNLFLVPLDHQRRWYRYHELFRAALLRDLERAEPSAAAELRGRAADWCEANGLAEEAMGYAIAAGDTDRMARLLLDLAFALYRAGRVATVEGWLARLDDGEILRSHPMLAALGAFVHALQGRAFQAERWLDAAGWAAEDAVARTDGQAGAWTATIEALACRRGVERMREDAARAVAELTPSSPLRPLAMWLVGLADLLEGHQEKADARLVEAAEAAHALGTTFVGVTVAAQRALLALARDDVDGARRLLADVGSLVDPERLQGYLPLALFHVAEASVHTRDGDLPRAARCLALAQRLRPRLTYAIPHYAALVLVEMGRVALALGDPGGARAVGVEAAAVLARRPDLGRLGDDLASLRREVDEGDGNDAALGVGLTAAELRLVPLLTTHLTFREIGERLFVSRNTVKTQAISIYRKLGVSSRGEAVERATELGLVDEALGG